MAATFVSIWLINNELGKFRFVYIDRSWPHIIPVPDDELHVASETSDLNSALTRLIGRCEFIVFSSLENFIYYSVNPLNAELNPFRHLLALVGARHIVQVSRIRVKKCQ